MKRSYLIRIYVGFGFIVASWILVVVSRNSEPLLPTVSSPRPPVAIDHNDTERALADVNDLGQLVSTMSAILPLLANKP